ncbi:Baculoviral IAP repeat-containing protein 2 [Gurleya vavrai]
MSSFESRLKSLQKFVPAEISKKELASCMFHSESTTSCLCELCNKNLDFWDKNDNPASEHYDHQSNCPIFNLQITEMREQTFPASFKDQKLLAKQGFFFYRLKDKTEFDLFCFRCGFYVSEYMNLAKENVQNHYKTCRKTRRNSKFNFENKNGLFYIDLVCGKYGESFEFYCNKNIHIPDDLKENYRETISSDCGSCLFKATGEVLKRKGNLLYKECEIALNKEIQDVLDGIDEKFEKILEQAKKKGELTNA